MKLRQALQHNKLIRAVRPVLKLNALLRSQYWDEESIRRLQTEQLGKLMQSAARVPFYSALFHQAGFAAKLTWSLDDLESLPPVSKQMFTGTPVESRILPGADPALLLSRFTSGSTGEPFTVLLTQTEKDARVLVEIRMLHAHGIGMRDSMMAFRRMSDVGPAGRISFLGFFPRCFGSMNLRPEEQLDLLKRTGPSAVKAHVNSLCSMADVILATGEKGVPGLRLIVSCAEYLGEPMRAHIEQSFGVPVADQYGTVEFGFVAWECPFKDGLHVNSEDFVLELLPEDGTSMRGEGAGEIVVTALRQHAMPLIRYRTGDIGQWVKGPCRCGRTLPRLRILRGRTADVVLRSDGSKLNPLFFTCICQGVDGVLQFQVVQESLSTLRFRYTASTTASMEAIEAGLRAQIQPEVGDSVDIIFERVERIEPGPSGKLKFVLSRIASS